jgi:hypothetical protein
MELQFKNYITQMENSMNSMENSMDKLMEESEKNKEVISQLEKKNKQNRQNEKEIFNLRLTIKSLKIIIRDLGGNTVDEITENFNFNETSMWKKDKDTKR